MSKIPSKEIIERITKEYPPGTAVECIELNDRCTPIPPGTKGKVQFVDDTGTIFVKWNNGSGIGVLFGVDRIKKI
jgi:hypothetical protein